MYEYIELSDGTRLKDTTALETDGNLFVYVRNGMDVRNAFRLMADPELTRRITAVRGSDVAIYTGYTRFVSIRDDGDGQVSAGLRKG